MVALTDIPSLAGEDPPGSRNVGIEMTESQFADAHWLAAVLARRTIDTSTQPSAAGETRELGDSILLEEMAPA